MEVDLEKMFLIFFFWREKIVINKRRGKKAELKFIDFFSCLRVTNQPPNRVPFKLNSDVKNWTEIVNYSEM